MRMRKVLEAVTTSTEGGALCPRCGNYSMVVLRYNVIREGGKTLEGLQPYLKCQVCKLEGWFNKISREKPKGGK